LTTKHVFSHLIQLKSQQFATSALKEGKIWLDDREHSEKGKENWPSFELNWKQHESRSIAFYLFYLHIIRTLDLLKAITFLVFNTYKTGKTCSQANNCWVVSS
jgi:hypothetical protein